MSSKAAGAVICEFYKCLAIFLSYGDKPEQNISIHIVNKSLEMITVFYSCLYLIHLLAYKPVKSFATAAINDNIHSVLDHHVFL